MEPAPDQSSRRVWLGFAALALLAGPVRSFTTDAFATAMGLQTLAGGALSGLLVGVVLLLFSVARRERMPGRTQWIALFVLLLPQWLAVPLTAPYVSSIPGLHDVRWGVLLTLALAAPLWLGLLSSMEWISVEVPRAAIGAAIAGIGAVYLVIPAESYHLAWDQAPVLAIQLLLSIAVVWSWAYAAPRLADAGTSIVAASFLLLNALVSAGFSLLYERSVWQPVDWSGLRVPLLMEAAVVACSCWLWFWLLQRMTLAGFSMRALAAWVAGLIPGFVMFGFLQWREDAALAIALAAIVVALRARVAEEQPTALGLNSD
jgi:hypothetical protein